MPKYRQLHTKIIDSDDFNEMPDDFTRLVWMLLPLILDCEGRGIDSMGWVKSKLFPKRTDEIETSQVAAAFTWFAGRKMLVRYEVNGRHYFYLPTFKLYQTGTQYEAKSVLPAPIPEVTAKLPQGNLEVAAEQVPAVASASASAIVSESVIESEIGGKSEIPEKLALTDMWCEGIVRTVTGWACCPTGSRIEVYEVLRNTRPLYDSEADYTADLQDYFKEAHTRYPHSAGTWWITEWFATGNIPDRKKNPGKRSDHIATAEEVLAGVIKTWGNGTASTDPDADKTEAAK